MSFPGKRKLWWTALLLILSLLSFALCASADGEYTLTLSTNEVQTEEEYNFTFTYPGASEIELWDSNGNYWHELTDTITDTRSAHFAQDVSFHARVLVNDEWLEVYPSETVAVSAPGGYLGDAQFSFAAEVQEGDNLVISYTPVENATDYLCWFYVDGGDFIDGSWFENSNIAHDETAHTFTVPASIFEPGQVYRFSCSANAKGYNHIVYEQCVMVNPVGATYENGTIIDDGNSSLTMRIGTRTVDCYTSFPITFYAPRADAIEIYRSDLEGSDPHEGVSGVLYYAEWRYPGEYTVSAMAHYPNDEGGYWTNPEDCQTVFTVVNPNGSLLGPDVSVQDKAFVGDVLTVHFPYVENAVDYSFWVHRWTGGGNGYAGSVYYSDNYQENRTVSETNGLDLTFDTVDLEPGVYWIECDVNAPGYTEGHTTRHLALLDPLDMDLSDNANYYFSVTSTEIKPVEQLRLIYYVPGSSSTRILVNDGENSEEIASAASPGLDAYWSYHNIGTRTFLGQYKTWDDSADAETDWSEPVELCQVNVAHPDGWLPAPLFDIPSVIAAGENLTIIFTEPVENAESYSYWYAKDSDRQHIDWQGFNIGDEGVSFPYTYTIPADQLEPGTIYRFFLDVDHVGWVEGHAEHLVYVLPEEGAGESGISFSNLPTGPIDFAEDFTYTVSAPGADYLTIYANDEFRYSENYEEPVELTESPYNDAGEAGTVTLLAQARIDGNWVAAYAEVSYNASTDFLDGPNYSISDIANAGEVVTVTINELVSNATYYGIGVSVDEPNGEMLYSDSRSVEDENNPTFPLTFTIPADKFEADTIYRVYIDVQAQGYVSSHAEHIVYVTDNNPSNDAIFIHAPEETPQFATDFCVSINAPGAEHIVVYDENNEARWFDGEWADMWYFGHNAEGASGSINVLAKAFIDGSWVGHAARADATYGAAEGQLDAPVWSFENASVTRGDIAVANVTPVKNATDYCYSIYNSSFEWVAGNLSEDPVIQIPTANLEVGEYSMHLWARGHGYVNGEVAENDEGYYLKLTVTEPSEGNSSMLSLSATEVITGANIMLSARALGSDTIRICITQNPDDVYDRSRDEDNSWFYYDGWTVSDTFWFDDEGTYYVYGVGHWTSEEGEPYWDYFGNNNEPIEVHVSAPYGNAPYSCNIPTLAEAGQPYTFSITPDLEDSNIDVWVEDCIAGRNVLESWRTYDETFEIPANRLVNGRIYEVHYRIFGIGYQSVWGSSCFLYGSVSDPAVTVTYPETATTFAADFNIHIEAPGASEIRVYSDHNGRWWFEGDTADCWYQPYSDDGGAGTVTFFVQANINGSWNHIVGPIFVNFSASLGTLDAPSWSFTDGATSATALRGEPVYAYLSPVSNGMYYHVFLTDEQGTWVTDFCSGEGDGEGVVRIQTADLEPGNYIVHAYVHGEGYLNGEDQTGESDLILTVTDPDSSSKLYVARTNLVTGEATPVSVRAPGAEYVIICGGSEGDIYDRSKDGVNERLRLEGSYATGELAFDFQEDLYLYAVGFWPNEDYEGGYWTDYLGVENEPPIEMHITAAADMPAPESDTPSLATSDGYTFHLWQPEEATNMDVYVTDLADPEHNIFAEWRTSNDTFYIPADRFQEGHIYEVHCWVWGYNFYPYGFTSKGFLYTSGDPMDHVTLTLPANLTTIEEEAFSGLPTTILYIPATVTSIADNAFAETYTIVIADENSTAASWAEANGLTLILR